MPMAMNKSGWPLLGWICLGTLLVNMTFAQAGELASDDPIAFFETRIRPVLVEHCYECHSANSGKLQGGLRLDDREAVLRGGDSGPAFVPGDPEQSLLIHAVRYESLEMPPKGKLPDTVVGDLVRWIQMGAPDPRQQTAPTSRSPEAAEARDHWAFQPIANPPLPQVIDSALAAGRQRPFHPQPTGTAGLAAGTGCRSLHLAPSRQFRSDRVAADGRRDSSLCGGSSRRRHYEAVVDRLLASRAFGERWARHWLDLVGYADQIGTSNNVFAEHAWRYRDYVIDAYNQDLPFDRFIREQIAGDLLPYGTVQEQADGITATGFLLLGDLEIVEADKAKLRVDIVDQQIRENQQGVSQHDRGLCSVPRPQVRSDHAT